MCGLFESGEKLEGDVREGDGTEPCDGDDDASVFADASDCAFKPGKWSVKDADGVALCECLDVLCVNVYAVFA